MEQITFNKATVRIFGLFSEEERRRIGRKPDKAGNLVVTIRDDRIEIAFDRQDVVYTAKLFPSREEAPLIPVSELSIGCCPICREELLLMSDDTGTALFCVQCKTVAVVYEPSKVRSEEEDQ